MKTLGNVMPRSYDYARAGAKNDQMEQFLRVLRSPVYGVFLFFCFFPYISVVPTGTDLQPYAMFMSFAVLALSVRQLPAEIWLLLGAVAGALLAWLASPASFVGMRGFAGYLSCFSVAAATYCMLVDLGNTVLIRRLLIVSAYIWLAAAILEMVFGPELFAILIPNMSMDADRGVAALATEPSFYGINCIFLLLLGSLLLKRTAWFSVLLIAQVLFLAQSSIATLCLLLLGIYWALLYVSVRNVMLFLLAVFAGYEVFQAVLPQFADLRIASLALDAVSDPLAILQVDVSLNARVGHLLYSVKGFFDHLGVPAGFDGFYRYVEEETKTGDYVWLGVLEPGMKIMSGYGAALFELGIFGLCIPAAITLAIFRCFRGSVKQAILWSLFVNSIMFAAIQISLPLLGVSIGLLAWRGRKTGTESIAT